MELSPSASAFRPAHGVLNRRLAGRDFVAGDYSIADMALVGWIKLHEAQGIEIGEFLEVRRWLEALFARPAVERAIQIGQERRTPLADDKEAQKILFNQRAR